MTSAQNRNEECCSRIGELVEWYCLPVPVYLSDLIQAD